MELTTFISGLSFGKLWVSQMTACHPAQGLFFKKRAQMRGMTGEKNGKLQTTPYEIILGLDPRIHV